MTSPAEPRAARKRPAAKAEAPRADAANEERLEALLAASPSPFSDAVLPNAFRETPDVPSIHAQARGRCLELVKSARDEGRTSLQVVAGDAGEGKTHLIAWLRRQSEEGWRKGTPTGRFAVAVIPPLRSVERARHHVLQEVVRQLSVRLPSSVHIDEATDTPVEILIWRALLAIGKVLVRDKTTAPELRARLEDATSENPDKYLSLCVEQLKDAWKIVGRQFVDAALRLPELAAADREVFRIVARFPDGDEAERTAIVDWLGGASLSSERLDSLGTSLVLDEEAEAGRGLKTLFCLAQLAATPMTLAFDQIEGTARLGEDAVAGFLGAITELYNDCPGTVLLVFCQTQLWPALRAQAPRHVEDRLVDSPVLHLKALTMEEAVLLVETRMKHFWEGVADGPKDPFFPLSRERVIADLERERLRTPRAVVRYFHSLLRESPAERGAFVPPAPPPPVEVVRRKLDALVDEERRTARPPDARAEMVQSVALDVFRHAVAEKRVIGGAAVESVEIFRARKTSTEGLRLVLRRGDERKRVYLETSNRQHGKSAASTIKRLADVLAADHADVALLLREEAFPLPPAARKALVELSPRGVMIRIAEGELAPLAAIEALLNAAAAGDIPVDRKTALDIAVQHLESSLAIDAHVVEKAFDGLDVPIGAPPEKHENGAPAKASPALPITSEAPSSRSLDPAAVETRLRAILAHLCSERAFEPVGQLATALGSEVEAVHADLQMLAARGLVDVVADRNRAPVALLRPEALGR